MIRSAALLARRVAGLPDRLARGFAVLALLVLAAAGATASVPAQAVTVAGPACAVESPRMAVLSGAQDAAQEAERSAFDRTDLRPADSEILTELGLPRAPVEAPRPRHTLSAAFAYRSDTVPAAVPHGSPHRPPRSA
ncbi:hypothetical protein MKK69_03305 [Methylobacterium sp. J-026]|uniref:hypothetical protein n=1 Tax=Methylobacterium sp. J-026 TaxID=2836624 RepID=UPI001FBB5038|nr:hypothetical protein [Methylobacterium sp. J-026]MCJ2133101.1 hypothetical protein [Methylobacterium sp. J-026]